MEERRWKQNAKEGRGFERSVVQGLAQTLTAVRQLAPLRWGAQWRVTGSVGGIALAGVLNWKGELKAYGVQWSFHRSQRELRKNSGHYMKKIFSENVWFRENVRVVKASTTSIVGCVMRNRNNVEIKFIKYCFSINIKLTGKLCPLSEWFTWYSIVIKFPSYKWNNTRW